MARLWKVGATWTCSVRCRNWVPSQLLQGKGGVRSSFSGAHLRGSSVAHLPKPLGSDLEHLATKSFESLRLSPSLIIPEAPLVPSSGRGRCDTVAHQPAGSMLEPNGGWCCRPTNSGVSAM